VTLTPWLFVGSVGLLMGIVAFATYHSGRLLRDGWLPPTNLLLSPPDNLMRLVVLGVCAGVGYAWGPGPKVLGWGTTYLAQDLAWGLSAGLFLALLVAGGGRLIARGWQGEGYDDTVVRSILPANGREWVGVSLALLPAAALEELLFRSLPLGGLAWLASPWWLMWPLALAFGLLHWPQGAWGVFGTALAAIALSWLFLATGSIWAAISAHYVMNLAQLIVAKRKGLTPARGHA
jgi:membrane protease YdiL (CAAX protease family)